MTEPREFPFSEDEFAEILQSVESYRAEEAGRYEIGNDRATRLAVFVAQLVKDGIVRPFADVYDDEGNLVPPEGGS